jgi:hypothetical protein
MSGDLVQVGLDPRSQIRYKILKKDFDSSSVGDDDTVTMPIKKVLLCLMMLSFPTWNKLKTKVFI